MRNLGLIFILLSILVSCKSKESLQVDVSGVRPQIESIATEIAKDNFIGTKKIGRVQEDSEAYKRRMDLMESASTEELVQLTDDTNAAVSLTALDGLYQRNYNNLPGIMAKYAERDDTIQYIKGDISREMSSLEYAYVYVFHKPLPGEELPEELQEKFSKYQLPETLESTIIEKIQGFRNEK